MPLYGFVCETCGTELEEFLPLADHAKTSCWPVCTHCHSRRAVRRKFTPPGGRREFMPYYSAAMGAMNDADRIPGESYNDDNRVLVTSPDHRKALMKRTKLTKEL